VEYDYEMNRAEGKRHSDGTGAGMVGAVIGLKEQSIARSVSECLSGSGNQISKNASIVERGGHGPEENGRAQRKVS